MDNKMDIIIFSTGVFGTKISFPAGGTIHSDGKFIRFLPPIVPKIWYYNGTTVDKNEK